MHAPQPQGVPGLFDLPRLKEVGANQYSEERGADNISPSQHGTSASYIVRRLKRDHAAMKAAGFVKMPRHGEPDYFEACLEKIGSRCG